MITALVETSLNSPVVWMGMAVMALPVLISCFNGVLSILRFFRKVPPDIAVYATKAELKEHVSQSEKELEKLRSELGHDRDEMEKRLSSHLESQDKELSSTNQELKSINRQLGELFGALRHLEDNPKRPK